MFTGDWGRASTSRNRAFPIEWKCLVLCLCIYEGIDFQEAFRVILKVGIAGECAADVSIQNWLEALEGKEKYFRAFVSSALQIQSLIVASAGSTGGGRSSRKMCSAMYCVIYISLTAKPTFEITPSNFHL